MQCTESGNLVFVLLHCRIHFKRFHKGVAYCRHQRFLKSCVDFGYLQGDSVECFLKVIIFFELNRIEHPRKYFGMCISYVVGNVEKSLIFVTGFEIRNLRPHYAFLTGKAFCLSILLAHRYTLESLRRSFRLKLDSDPWSVKLNY